MTTSETLLLVIGAAHQPSPASEPSARLVAVRCHNRFWAGGMGAKPGCARQRDSGRGRHGDGRHPAHAAVQGQRHAKPRDGAGGNGALGSR